MFRKHQFVPMDKIQPEVEMWSGRKCCIPDSGFFGQQALQLNCFKNSSDCTFSDLKIPLKSPIGLSAHKNIKLTIVIFHRFCKIVTFGVIFKLYLMYNYLIFKKQFNCKSCWPMNQESGKQHFLRDHTST